MRNAECGIAGRSAPNHPYANEESFCILCKGGLIAAKGIFMPTREWWVLKPLSSAADRVGRGGCLSDVCLAASDVALVRSCGYFINNYKTHIESARVETSALIFLSQTKAEEGCRCKAANNHQRERHAIGFPEKSRRLFRVWACRVVQR